MDRTYVSLLVITALAAVVPPLAGSLKRLKIPIVVGEIICGVIIGKSGLDLIAHSPVLDFLAEFGFALLMYLSGLEVDFNLLTASASVGEGGSRPSWLARPLPMALIMLGATTALAFGGAAIFAHLGSVKRPLLFGLILSTTSLGVVLPVLKERKLVGGEFGQYVLVAASIADLVTLLLLSVVIAMLSHGLKLDVLLIFVLLAVFALAARLSRPVGRFMLLRRVAEELAHATAQLRVRGAFALMVAWVVLAHAVGAELILGAFLAGVILGLATGPTEEALREKLDAIGFGFFIPIFFIMVGVGFDLRSLLDSPRSLMLVPVVLLLAYFVKIAPAMLLRLRFTTRESIAAGVLLSSRLSLIIAVSAIALKIGAIDAALNAAIVLVAALTCTVSPLAFQKIYPRASTQKRSGVIVVGASPLARMLTKRLLLVDSVVTLVCDEDETDRLGDLAGDAKVVRGPKDDAETLARAGAAEAESLVIVAATVAETIRVAELATERFEVPLVVARTRDVDAMQRLQAMNVRVVQPILSVAVALEGALRFPVAFDVMQDLEDGLEFGEATVRSPAMVGKRLREIALPESVLLLSIRRGDKTLEVPHGDTELRRGDHLALVGSPDCIERTVAMFGGGSEP